MNITSNKNFSFFLSAVKLVFLIALFYLLFHQISALKFSYTDFNNLIKYFFKNTSYFVLAVLLLGVNYGLESWKWILLTQKIEARDFKAALSDILNGLMSGLFTPFMLGDFVGRSFNFAYQKRSMAFASNVFNSICQTYTAILLGTIALAFWYFNFEVPYRALVSGLLLLFTIMSVAGIFFVLNVNFSWAFAKKISILRYFFGGKITHLEVDTILRIKVLILSIFRNLVFFYQFWFIYLGFGLDMDFEISFVGIHLIYLVKTVGGGLNVFGDLSLRELIGLNFFGYYGYDKKITLVSTFFIWFINIFLPVFVGFIIKNTRK